MSAKTVQPKPRRMWANYYPDGDIVLHSLKTLAAPSADPNANYRAIPVAAIPLNNVDNLIERAASAIAKERGYGPQYAPKFFPETISSLVAIGVLPKQRKGRK